MRTRHVYRKVAYQLVIRLTKGYFPVQQWVKSSISGSLSRSHARLFAHDVSSCNHTESSPLRPVRLSIHCWIPYFKTLSAAETKVHPY